MNLTRPRIAVSRTTTGMVAACLVGWVYVAADAGEKVSFPTEYRQWVHVKSTLIGPASKGFNANGGLHHYYANAKAVEGYRTGKFPDGSVVVDERLQTSESDGVISEGPRRRLNVMVKESQRYRETGGWGFESFDGESGTDGILTPEHKAACFACHSNKREQDFVFSRIRE